MMFSRFRDDVTCSSANEIVDEVMSQNGMSKAMYKSNERL